LSGLGGIDAKNADLNVEGIPIHWLRTSLNVASIEDGGRAREKSDDGDQAYKWHVGTFIGC
jgi:hypothetical protein